MVSIFAAPCPPAVIAATIAIAAEIFDDGAEDPDAARISGIEAARGVTSVQELYQLWENTKEEHPEAQLDSWWLDDDGMLNGAPTIPDWWVEITNDQIVLYVAIINESDLNDADLCYTFERDDIDLWTCRAEWLWSYDEVDRDEFMIGTLPIRFLVALDNLLGGELAVAQGSTELPAAFHAAIANELAEANAKARFMAVLQSGGLEELGEPEPEE